jgi:AcrR family transcriptional regulator
MFIQRRGECIIGERYVNRNLGRSRSELNPTRTRKRKYELRARAESQRRTRERIVQATMELHEEVGPAKTTVAEIARRAGVQRLTVYNHFPKEIELFGACQAHWMRFHPLPDLSAALSLPSPTARLQAVLREFYGWYREAAPMSEKIQRDRGAIPALDALMKRTVDAQLAELTQALAKGFHSRGRRAERQRTLVRLALDFWTWRRLDHEGLDDETAADLMSEAVACASASGQ